MSFNRHITCCFMKSFKVVVDRDWKYAQKGNDMINTIRNGANRVGGMLNPAVLTPQQQSNLNMRQ